MAQARPSAGAVDSHGYALYGTPGPAQYEAVSQFEKGGQRIFYNDGAFSIQGRWKAEKIAFNSPGPQAHHPKNESVTADPNHAVFGHATRSTEAKLFTSPCLVSSSSHEPRVGPGAYRVRGYAKTFSDGPSTAMGAASRMPEVKTTAAQSPGAKYNIPSSLRTGPVLLGPQESAFGTSRDRRRDARNARRQYHGPGVPASVEPDNPAPGQYMTEDSSIELRQKAVRAVINRAPLTNAAKLATGGSVFEEGMKGTESAAKFYDPPSYLEHRGCAASYAPRFPDATKGLEGTGPFISKQHVAHVLGVESPGAKYDVDSGYKASHQNIPAFTMASSRPQPPDTSATPGAAAYLLKKDSAAYKHPAAAAFSMSCGRAFQPPEFCPAGPGPGAHECQRGISHPDIRHTHTGATRMSKAEDKNGRMGGMMTRENVPGPGTYIGVESKPCGPKFTMHGRDGSSKESTEADKLQGCHREGASPQGKRNFRRFYSRLQAESEMGHETLGARLANLQGLSTTGKEISAVKKYVGKMPRSGRAEEAKLLVSRFHSKACVGEHSPGPAQYSPERALASEAQSTHRHQGGFTFGKAGRPGLAKITF